MRAAALLLPTVFLATPLVAQETRFTREMPAGSRLELMNINGAMTITQGTGRTLNVAVTKTVKRGSGDKVRAVMEEENGLIRICTIDQNRAPSQKLCKGAQDASGKTGRDDDEVDMRYTVTLPAGVTLAASNVNGPIDAKGIAHADKLATVNGTITFTGQTASALNTVNGSIEASLTSATWTGTLDLQTVNGSVTVQLPANAELTVRAQTVNGSVHSDFPQLTSSGSIVSHSLKGMLGKGGRTLDLQTVSGSVSVVKQ